MWRWQLSKLLTGIFGRSYALIADAIESMADAASSVIVWRAVVIAEKPADKDHPTATAKRGHRHCGRSGDCC